jgi:NADH-quinone oxidoreductase subunit M
MVLGACYLLWMLRSVVFGPLREPAHEAAIGAGAGATDHAAIHEPVPPIGWHEIAGMTPLLALIVLIGVFPGPVLTQIRPAVRRIDQNVQGQLARVRADQEAARFTASPRRGGGGGASKKQGSGQSKGAAKGAPAPARSAPAPAKEAPKR